GRATGAEEVGNVVVTIFQNRKSQFVFLGMGYDSVQGVLLVRVDGQELHAPRAKLSIQLGQARHIVVVDRAFGADKHDGDRLLVLEIVQTYLSGMNVRQLEAGDFLADGIGRLGGEQTANSQIRKKSRRGDKGPSLDHEKLLPHRSKTTKGDVGEE